MKTWQILILLSAIAVAPHVSIEIGAAVGVFYLVAAIILMFFERK